MATRDVPTHVRHVSVDWLLVTAGTSADDEGIRRTIVGTQRSLGQARTI